MRSLIRIFKIPLFLLSADRRGVLYIKGVWLGTKIMGGLSFFLKAHWFGITYKSFPDCFGVPSFYREAGSSISIGSNVQLISSSSRCTSSTLYAPVRIRTLSPGAQVIIDDNAGLNGTSITARSRTIRIGKGVLLAPNVTIVDSSFHALWPAETRWTSPDFEGDEDITIADNAWIGMQCVILKGAVIGKYSVIAAGSVVTSKIPENVLAGGIPAKVIRPLAPTASD